MLHNLHPTRFEENKKLSIDWLGTLILTLTAIFLAYGINQIDSSHFLNSLISLNVLPFLILFIIFLFILVKIEKRAKESVIPIHMLHNKEISTACILILFWGIVNSISIFIPSLAIISLGYNNQMASLMLIPLVGTNAIAAPIVGKYLYNIGYKKIMGTGTISLVIGCILLALFNNNLLIFLFSGILMGYGLVTLVGAPMRYLVLSETSAGERGTGQALINMLSSVGQLVGGALIGGLIASFGGTLYGYTITILFTAIFAAIAFIFTRKLKNRDAQIATMKSNM